MPPVVVTDTGPVLHLVEAGGLRLLHVYSEVIVTPKVEAELTAYAVDIRAIPNLRRVPPAPIPSDIADLVFRNRIHAAEAEAIATALEIRAMLLTDDLAARRAGIGKGLAVRGVLGIVIDATASKAIARSEAHDWIDRISQTSLYVTPRVTEQAHRLLDMLDLA